MLDRYAPTERLANLDLDGTQIVLQRIDDLWTGLGYDRARVKALTIEREGQKGKPCLLILWNPTIWDAKTEGEMLFFNNEFTVLDADGVCFSTIIHFVTEHDSSRRMNVVEIPSTTGRKYYVDIYFYGPFWSNPPPVAEPIGEPAAYVVRDDEDAKWFVPLSQVGIRTLDLVDGNRQLVVRVGGRSIREIIWQGLGSSTFGPRRRLRIRHLNKTVPKEVVIFLAAYKNS